MVEGRRRWIERMRAAKARGELARLPGGRRSRGLPKLSRDKKIRRAQRILEKKMAARKKAAVSAVAKRQWQELDKAGKLSEATDRSLDRVYDFLRMDVDPVEDPKLFALQQQVALSTISNQIRLDAAVLQAHTALSAIPEETLERRLEQAFARLDELPEILEEEGGGRPRSSKGPA
jgi:hypothetical protein